jgi:hypothetical protein
LKNDYSKVFAMLRPVRSGLDGMAGFARIEMRSGKGRMSLNVHGAKASKDAVLVAVLVANDGVSAFECGRLTAGGRGQFSLMYEFDPGDIGGVALDGYTAAAVVSRQGSTAEPLLAGIFGRRGVNDWSTAVASLGEKTGTVLYEEEPEEDEEKREYDGEDQKNTEENDDEKDKKNDKKIKKPPEQEDGCGEREGNRDKAEEDNEEGDEAPYEEENGDEKEKEEKNAKEVFKVEDDYAPVEKPVRLCAEDLVWQGYSYAMKPLFLKHTPVEPFGAIKDMLFVRVDMPVKCAGADHYILGARARGDEVERLCIGVPGRGGVIPPAGLEGSQWKSDGRGGGYWLSWQDAYMGYPIRGEL